ncbi:PLP-dependent aminotransferase family protein [Vibrio furnissii]|uniref:aminotransferase-like domain-containing protein n=1 Tax=Vibrio furnissii TaxID=29494 RepID=UPI000200E06F|nr:PLP-dependent aminotransferase family protein [Vibrio furnissii]ADT89438.1 Transcriptional regulator [Vibrio furnissii NCTC 11218]
MKDDCKYSDVEAQLRQSMEDGLFQAHDKLPSIRQLSERQRVGKNTVIRAYQELEAQGWVYAVPRSGYRVAERALKTETPSHAPSRVDLLSMSKSILTQPIIQHDMPAGSAHPDTDSPAIRSLYAEIGRHSRLQTHMPCHYQLPPGHDQLVRQLRKITRDLGIDAQRSDIAITHGGQQAISLALRALTQPGDIVAVESPCYFGTLLLLESLGLRVIEIACHPATGIDIDALQDAVTRWPIKALLVTPNFNNPTGAQMPLSHRQALLAVTRTLPIIEDDVFGSLGFGEPIPSLKALDTEERVIYLNSLSKTLDSRLRIGWIVAGRYLPQIEKVLLSENMGSLNLMQSAVAEFLTTGKYRTHLARMRRVYQQRQQRFARLLHQAFQQQPALAGRYHLSRPDGSFLCWLTLPHTVDTYRIYHACLAKKISLLPGHLFATQGQFNHCIRFSVATLNDDATWLRSLTVLAALIAEQLQS